MLNCQRLFLILKTALLLMVSTKFGWQQSHPETTSPFSTLGKSSTVMVQRIRMIIRIYLHMYIYTIIKTIIIIYILYYR